MQRVHLILVGGFLGAGKTTLLAQAAQRLAAAGKRVGLITNDQATNLVDTAMLERQGASVQEVAGGCFCCRFDDLIAALKQLMAGEPDVVLAEPVGSCTDVSATVLQPLKQIYGELFRLAPFSVLADPERLREALGGEGDAAFPDSVLYIFRKQLEEADLIVVNKADLLSDAELAELREKVAGVLPGTQVATMSALTGEGVDAWLARIAEPAPAGQHIADVDYDTYADGEAVLGWLNAAVDLRTERTTDWAAFCLGLVGRMQEALRDQAAEVGHLKLHLQAGGSSVVANLTRGNGAPSVRGAIEGSPQQATLLLNARVHIEPDALRSLVERCLESASPAAPRATIRRLESFAPARPQPTHRFNAVV